MKEEQTKTDHKAMAFSTYSMSATVVFCNKESGLNLGALQTMAIFEIMYVVSQICFTI